MEKFTFESIRDDHTEEVRNNSNSDLASNPEIVVHPSECVLTHKFEKDFDRIYNFEVFPDDVWIVTYPKSGTTWTQEMVWLLVNKLDFKTARSVHLRYRCPFLELESITSVREDREDLLKTIELSASMKRPRCIKSHLPLELLPKGLWVVKPKIVYVSRDPRDVAISYYHHYCLWNGYQGKLEDFTKVFLADRHVYSPFWKHNLGFWNLTDKSHVLINSFEEMKKDLSSVIRKTANFLQVKISDRDVEELKNHLSFDSMKNNNTVNYSEMADQIKKATKKVDDNLVFIRKGECGNWKNTFSKEIIEQFNKWTAEKLAGTQYKQYPYSAA